MSVDISGDTCLGQHAVRVNGLLVDTICWYVGWHSADTLLGGALGDNPNNSCKGD